MKKRNLECLPPFKLFVLQNFPFLEYDFGSLCNEEILYKLIAYLDKTGIEVNKLIDFFKNLNVQEEINNKLDELAESGELQTIILNYLHLTKTYEIYQDMLDDNSLAQGNIVHILGYYSVNDGGESYYFIEDEEPTDYHITLPNGKYARLLVKDNTVNVKQFGAIGDNVMNDTQSFKKAIESGYDIYIPIGRYLITEKLEVPFNIKIKGQNKFKSIINSTIENDYTIQYGPSYDYNGHGGIIENITITSSNEATLKPYGIYLNSGCIIRNIRFYTIGKCIDRVYNYIDNITIDDVYCGYCVPNGDYIIKLNGNQDNLEIDKLKIARLTSDTTIYNGLYISRCHGGSIKNSIVNFNLSFELVNAFSIENCHLENINDIISITDSNISIKDTFKFKNYSVPDIKILNGNYDKSSSVILENVSFYTNGVNYNATETFSEEIDELPINTTISINKVYRQFNFADKNRTTANNYGILIKNLTEFNEHSSDYSQFSTISSKAGNLSITNGFVDKDGEITASGIGAIASSNILTWKSDNYATLKYRIINVIDETRKLSLGNSNESAIANVITNGNGVAIALNEKYGTQAIIYSGSTTNAYTRKCRIPLINRSLLFDNGINICGYTVENLESPTNGTSEYTKITKYIKRGGNVDVYRSSVPTLGVWKKGDRVFNTSMASGNVISWTYDGTTWLSNGLYT